MFGCSTAPMVYMVSYEFKYLDKSKLYPNNIIWVHMNMDYLNRNMPILLLNNYVQAHMLKTKI